MIHFELSYKKYHKSQETSLNSALSRFKRLKFRMWFKYGLKAQKLLAQGIALGVVAISKVPCKGKSFVNYLILKAFALTGRQVCVHKHPGRCPGLRASAPSIIFALGKIKR